MSMAFYLLLVDSDVLGFIISSWVLVLCRRGFMKSKKRIAVNPRYGKLLKFMFMRAFMKLDYMREVDHSKFWCTKICVNLQARCTNII